MGTLGPASRPTPPSPAPQRSRWVLVFLLGLGTIALIRALSYYAVQQKAMTYSEFYRLVQENPKTQEIAEARLVDNMVEGRLSSGQIFRVFIPSQNDQLIQMLRENISTFDVQPPQAGFLGILMAFAPWIVLLGIMWFVMRSAQGGGRLLSFGKSRARLVTPETGTRVTFDDVAGIDEAKEELREIIEFLKDPKRFQRLGGKIPKGVLLIGLPGTGKTLLAKAVAGEANVPFYSISGSDFVEMFVGVGASVTGDTPVLIRDGEGTRLLPIGEFVDRYYEPGRDGFVVPTPDVVTLGFEPAPGHGFGSNQLRFGRSGWQRVAGAYRHRVSEIYEIHHSTGMIRATAEHSVFVRRHGGIVPIAVRDLKPGDALVSLPYKTRLGFLAQQRTQHEVRAHSFGNEQITFEVEPDVDVAEAAYAFAMTQRDILSQAAIAETIGVSQATVGLWQRGVHRPRVLSLPSWAHGVPQRIAVSPELMRVLGFYTAEGRFAGHFMQFVFGAHERPLHQACIELMQRLFSLSPSLEATADHTLRLTYHSTPVGEFFVRQCGNGSHHKHVPECLWDLPIEYFRAYLEGLALGDGYTTQEGKLSITSVSQQLIRELAWLCAMHGIGTGIRHGRQLGGRTIKQKPLPDGEYWNLIIGKTSHPFRPFVEGTPNRWKKLRVEQVIKRPYDGYVYDLCGCEHEAFFGGERPVLLHNSRVRDLFDQARRNARQGGKGSIVFIDEIDAVGRQRFAGIGGGHDEREQTLNALLVEMDGFDTQQGIILVAATNRPDVLDPALLRPGRFDRQVVISLPDIVGREAILKVHTRKIKLGKEVDLKSVARQTPGFSGADLANLANEAALLAARRNKEGVGTQEMEAAIERVIAGPERKTRVLNEREKKITAFHEAGHALVALLTPGTDPVHKVSIIPRGAHALGYTMQLPLEDRYTMSKQELTARMTVMMGGRAAEELVFSEITTGAQNDIETATDLARRMVCEFGMSDRLGNLTYGRRERQMFLGRDLFEDRNYSEQTAVLIDEEIRRLVDACYLRARQELTEHRAKLDAVANTLLEKEVLDGAEVRRIAGFPPEAARSSPGPSGNDRAPTTA